MLLKVRFVSRSLLKITYMHVCNYSEYRSEPYFTDAKNDEAATLGVKGSEALLSCTYEDMTVKS